MLYEVITRPLIYANRNPVGRSDARALAERKARDVELSKLGAHLGALQALAVHFVTATAVGGLKDHRQRLAARLALV